MEASLILTESSHGRFMAEEVEEQEDLASVSSFMSEEDGSSNSIDSSSEELREDAASSSSSFSSYQPSSSSAASLNDQQLEEGHVFEMSSLISILPFKRGLSKHYDGKSQSFTSLSNVSSLEDLAKPERTWMRKKKIKSCKSYAGGLDIHNPFSPRASSRVISKKASRGSFSSPKSRSHSFFVSKPPMPPQRANCISDHQALLFA